VHRLNPGAHPADCRRELAPIGGCPNPPGPANAALAGVAAADAACCRALGERSRGDDHRHALALVGQVSPGGPDAANALVRLLAVKNDAEYGLTSISKTTREPAGGRRFG
jgi:hypothetical protein